jgi:hypothetical protein
MASAEEMGDQWTVGTFDSLASALGIRWPAWYPPFVLELATGTDTTRPYWLPGGFIYSSPRDVYENTVTFRAGRQFFCGGTWDRPGEPRPLPHPYIMVGRTGEGPVIVDTANEAAVLLWLDKEGYWREPLIDFAATGRSPVDIARSIVASTKTV